MEANINITISGKDFKLTPSLKNYVHEKIGRLVRFAKDAERIGVELDVDHNHKHGSIYRAEVWVYLPGETVQAGEKAEEMHAAIDAVYHKLERRLVDRKEKQIAARRG